MNHLRVLVLPPPADTPANPGLEHALQELPAADIVKLESAGNLGQALRDAARRGDDILLLPGDCTPVGDALTQMLRVSTLDAMIGFVVPWSDGFGINGTDGVGGDLAAFLRRLPELSFVPAIDPVACWVEGRVLAEFAGEVAPGDLTLMMARANRVGYRVALANRAIVLSGTSRASMRGPEPLPAETDALEAAYRASPSQRAQFLLRQLHPIKAGALNILFDLSHLSEAYNGTFEAARHILASAVRAWPASLDIAVAASEEAWRFHHLDAMPRVRRVDPEAYTVSAIVIRIGQPYQSADLRRLFMCAPIVAVYMLDTIAFDCGYLSLKFDPAVWAATMQLSDLIVTNSAFTLQCLERRFPPGQHTRTLVSRHSLSVLEYAPPTDGGTRGDALMVVGNGYAHKFVPETVEQIASRYPSIPLIALGFPAGRPVPAGVTAIASGGLDAARIEQLYDQTCVVVFPSHYEGFGFPILHALAREKPVFVRDTALNRELSERLPETANVHLYRTTSDLLEQLDVLPTWQAPQHIGQRHTWDDSAMEIWHSIEECMAAASQRPVAARLAYADLTLPPLAEQLPYLTPAQRLALRAAPWLDRLLAAWPTRLARDWLRRRRLGVFPSHNR